MGSAMTLEMVRDELSKHGHEFGYETCERFVQAIDAHLSDKAGARVDGWLPIESAPKNGRKMILLLTPSRFPQVAFSNTWWTAGFSAENKPTHYLPIPELPEQSCAL